MTIRTRLLLATAIGFPSLAAAQPVTGPYVSLGGGGNFLQNEIVTPKSALGPSKRSYVFDPGGAGEVSVGYGLGNGLRLEIEGDYAYNHARKAESPVPLRAGGYQQQYGGFANALYDIDLGVPVVPYVGVGVGYQELEQDGINSGPQGVVIPNRSGSSSQGSFAYQGIAGLSYPLDVVPGLALTLEYRFIGVTDQNFNRTSYAANGAAVTSRAKFSNIFNHEILGGIRYAFYTPPPPPPPAPVPAVVPTQVARSYLIFFDWDRADLTDRARQIIGEAARASTHVQTTQIEVNGYTDTSGTPKYNQGLSIRRARTVEGELVRDGVPQTVIHIQGFGETHLLVATGPGVREPQNRRVEIILK